MKTKTTTKKMNVWQMLAAIKAGNRVQPEWLCPLYDFASIGPRHRRQVARTIGGIDPIGNLKSPIQPTKKTKKTERKRIKRTRVKAKAKAPDAIIIPFVPAPTSDVIAPVVAPVASV